MRKDAFVKTSLLLLVAVLCTVGFSLVFLWPPSAVSDSTTSLVGLEPTAVNGQGHYNFYISGNVNPDNRWYISLEAKGAGNYQSTTVGSGVSLNITSGSIDWQKGKTWGGGNYNYKEKCYYIRVYCNDVLVAKQENIRDFNENFYNGSMPEGTWKIEAKLQWHYGWGYTNTDNDTILLIFHVDRTNPEVTLDGVIRNGITNGTVRGISQGKSWDGDTLTMKYGYSKLDSGKPTTADRNYNNGQGLSAEGHYCIKVTDSAGNTSDFYRFTIDTTKPQNNFAYQLNNNKAYTSEDIVYKPTDNYALDKSWVKYENGPWVSSQAEADAAGYGVIYNGNQVTVPNDNPNGNWYFRASDTAGNYSDEYCVVLNVLQTFGNQAIIRDSYKSNYWYNVVLPTNIFGVEGKNIAGTYHAPSYQTALAFARAKEWEYRVSVVAVGWMYVSAGNGNLAQLYTDRDELDSVVEKYAKTYIKDRSIAKNGTNTFGNIINDDLYLDNTALTRQQMAKPDFLDKDLPVYLMQQNYCFVDPQFPYQTFAKIQMVANDFGLVERSAVDLLYGQKVADQVLVTGNNSQGYYLVTEWDTAGNVEEYYVYIDLSAPTLSADVTYGNDTKETIVFNESKIAELAGTFRYLSLDNLQITDSVDRFVTLKINGRKLTDASFIQGDALPVLDGVDYYGNYTLELYDRSGNTLTFMVTIAGEAPNMTNSSLSSDTSCRLTLNVPDRNDSITNIKLFYITYEGEYQELTTDHKGVPVSADTLQYTLLTGGKYTLWYQDLFGREAYCPYVFYLKGLPTGTLSGVMEGGITNKNVSLKYDDTATLILYRVENGNKTEVPLDGIIFGQTYDETTRKYTATLMANEDTSAAYCFFLYKTGDKGLFVEYTFSIDCIIAPIYLYDTDGNTVAKNAYTTKPFSVYWNETVTLRYYTAKTPGGEMGAVRYTMGAVLAANDTYFFTLRDSVGNQETFTILLDSVVSYELGGEYVTLGEHEYIAKDDLRFTITEATAVAEFTSIPDVVSGGYITLEGTYNIWITDAYGNSVEITITIDRTAPTITLLGVGDNGATNAAVQVNFVDYANAYLVNSRDQILGNVADGQVFDSEGTYRIMAVDVVGNAAFAVFAINRTIPYESNVADGTFTTGSVTVQFLGTLATQTVICDDREIEVAKRYLVAGNYTIYASDTLGNSMQFSFTILPKRVQAIDLPLADYELLNVILDGVPTAVTLTDDRLYLDINGKYNIKMKNTKNNSQFVFDIEVDNVVLFDANFVNGGLTTDAATLTFKENVTQTVFVDGVETKTAKQYSKAGDYQITATDELGNVATITFTILPQRAREIHLTHLDNYELVLVTLDTKTIAAGIVDNTLTLTDKGMYGIMLRIKNTTDVFGFGIEVDNTLPTVEIIKDAGSFKTANASKENITAVLTCNGEILSYSLGRRHEGAGLYTLTLTDDLGNVNVYSFTITEPLNWAAYASFAGLGLLAAVVVIVVLIAKRRVKTR